MKPPDLQPLPHAADCLARRKTVWPRGWWLSDGLLGCCDCRGGRRIPRNRALFLTGETGHVYCATHAPAHGGDATHGKDPTP